MNKAFPDLKIPTASKEEIKSIKKAKKYSKTGISVDKIKPPFYADGYSPERFECLVKYKEFFKSNFKPLDFPLIADLVKEIENKSSCAIHVRRGDLAKPSETYGYPTEKEYFINAAKIAKAFLPNVKFFFFSDEPDWVRENLVTDPVFADCKYKITDENAIEKGYLDLYLLTCADCIISSQGSFGYFGKILSSKNPILILARYEKNLLENFEKCIYINEDTELRFKHSKQKITKTPPPPTQ